MDRSAITPEKKAHPTGMRQIHTVQEKVNKIEQAWQ